MLSERTLCREKAAQALSGIVGVGAVDADTHKQLGGQYGVQGFPTIKFVYYDSGKIKSVDYKGGRSAKEIVEFGMDKAKNLALKRIGAKPSATGGGGGGSGGGGGGGTAGGSGARPQTTAPQARNQAAARGGCRF